MSTDGPHKDAGSGRPRWLTAVLSIVAGLVLLAIRAAGHQLGQGIAALGVMTAFAIVLLAGGERSETMRALRGDGRDERFAAFNLRAQAFTGRVITLALVVLSLIQVARHHSGGPYTWLTAGAGGAYLAAIAWQRARR